MSELLEPGANPELFGHERAEAIFVRALGKGRMHHAWLLCGPRGVGKATLAYRCARRLLAGEDHARAAVDPTHPVFRMVASKAHPDLRVLERVINPKTGKLFKEILIDQVRSAEDTMHATAARAGRKVLLVDPADELNASGANALLKLLEEPPASVVILLVCQRPGLLPRTILSRCSQLHLAPLGPDHILTALGRLAPELVAERATALAEAAQGSIGRALLLEQGSWLERYADLLHKLVEARASTKARLALATKLVPAADGQGFRATADLIATVLRRVASLQAGRAPSVELVAGERDLLAALAAGRGLDHWVAMWDKLTALAGRVDAVNLDPLQTLLQIVQAVCGADPEAELSIA